MGVDYSIYIGPYAECFYGKKRVELDMYDRLSLCDNMGSGLVEKCDIWIPNEESDSWYFLDPEETGVHDYSVLLAVNAVSEFQGRYSTEIAKLFDAYSAQNVKIKYGIVQWAD